MKFGKRLAAEAARCSWGQHYLDYKAAKRSLKLDVTAGGTARQQAWRPPESPITSAADPGPPLPRRPADPAARRFEAVLLQQLDAVSKFFERKAGELEVGGRLDLPGGRARRRRPAPRPSQPRQPTGGIAKRLQRRRPLQELLDGDAIDDPAVLSGAKTDIQQLIKFVALNYLAVVKAIKKRNRHLQVRPRRGARHGCQLARLPPASRFPQQQQQQQQPRSRRLPSLARLPRLTLSRAPQVAFGEGAAAMHPMEVLSHEVFFTSPRLAALATQVDLAEAAQQHKHGSVAAEALQVRVRQGPQGCCEGCCGDAAQARGCCCGDAMLPSRWPLLSPPPACLPARPQDYQCPICLDVLRSPVVLTCAHRFCWGCLVAHFAALRSSRGADAAAAAGGAPASDCSLVVLEKIVAACEEADERSSSFYACPCCRKPQVLSIEKLQVRRWHWRAGLAARSRWLPLMLTLMLLVVPPPSARRSCWRTQQQCCSCPRPVPPAGAVWSLGRPSESLIAIPHAGSAHPTHPPLFTTPSAGGPPPEQVHRGAEAQPQ
jgi:hypothetical protein